MKHSFARGGFGYVGLGASVVIGAVLVLLVILLVNSRTKSPEPPPPPPFDRLRLSAMYGDVEFAQKLAQYTGKDGSEAMLEVLEHSDNEEVKIACIRGLGANKYFDAGPALFKIIAADDDRVDLRHQAFMATRTFMSDHPIELRMNSLEVRREVVKQMMAEWESRKKDKEAKMASQGK